MAKLTDKQKKNIIAGLVEGESIRALAKKYKVSTTTIQRIKNSNEEVTQKVTQKKEENTKSILAHMDEKKDVVCEIIDSYLKALADPERLESSSTREIATALGIVIDKFTRNGADDANTSEEKQENLLKAIEEAVNGGDK